MASKPSPSVGSGQPDHSSNEKAKPHIFGKEIEGLEASLKAVVLEMALVLRFYASVFKDALLHSGSRVFVAEMFKH